MKARRRLIGAMKRGAGKPGPNHSSSRHGQSSCSSARKAHCSSLVLPIAVWVSDHVPAGTLLRLKGLLRIMPEQQVTLGSRGHTSLRLSPAQNPTVYLDHGNLAQHAPG